MQPSQFAPALVSHLVSRVPLCGGGGMDPRSSGVTFMLSPRVAFIECVVSGGNTDQRPILHLRDESHAGGRGLRLHLNCGDRNMSHLSLGLRFGTTALVALLGGRGLKPPTAARIMAPLRAMRAFACDATLKVTVRCADGRQRAAVQISRLIAQWVARYVADLPPWAGVVLQQWNAVLDLLETGGAGATGAMLDWAILHGLFTQTLHEHGFAEQELLRSFNRKLATAERALHGNSSWPGRGRIIGLADFQEPGVRRALEAAGLALEDALRVARLRAELAEMFTRYADLADGGLFRTLDRAGVLRHGFPGVDEAAIQHAEQRPPADTRARIRGALVREYGTSAKRRAFHVNWSRITDRAQCREIDLSDPFDSAADWRSAVDSPPLAAEPLARGNDLTSVITAELNDVTGHYDRGWYAEALVVLEDCRPLLEGASPEVAAQFALWEARIRGRLGDPLGASRALSANLSSHMRRFAEIAERACIFRFAGLTPPPEIDPWLTLGQRWIEQHPGPLAGAPNFLDHLGYTLLRRGRFAEAATTLERAVADGGHEARILARSRADLADALRSVGRFAEAAAHLDAAGALQLPRRYFGELAEFTLTVRGRLAAHEGRRLDALSFFQEAAAGLPPNRSPVAFVRAKLLDARSRGAGATAAAIRTSVWEVRAACPALVACPLLAQVLDHWDAWLSGAPPPFDHPDVHFWGM